MAAAEAVHKYDRRRARARGYVVQSHVRLSRTAASGLRRVALFAVAVLAVAVGVLGHALDGDDTLALLGLEDAHALRVARGDAHVVDGAADQLARVGDEHDLVAVLD